MLGSHRPVFLKKHNNCPFWNLNFGISNINFMLNFCSFLDMIWPDVSFLSLENQFILYLLASFHVKFRQKDKSFIQLTQMYFSPFSIFLTNIIFQFELHPHIGEIGTKISVYEKCVVIKHIKTPARVKVQLPDLLKR